MSRYHTSSPAGPLLYAAGVERVIHTDIRLVSATHESLRRLVRQREFREDLMYRVRVVPLYLPPLRARAGDVDMLIWEFINRLNHENERTITRIAASAYEALVSYEWPGNIRELDNVITYTHAIDSGNTVYLKDLPPELRGEAPPDEVQSPLEDKEREQIMELMQRYNSHKQSVAQAMGISRATLWRKMKSLQLM